MHFRGGTTETEFHAISGRISFCSLTFNCGFCLKEEKVGGKSQRTGSENFNGRAATGNVAHRSRQSTGIARRSNTVGVIDRLLIENGRECDIEDLPPNIHKRRCKGIGRMGSAGWTLPFR